MLVLELRAQVFQVVDVTPDRARQAAIRDASYEAAEPEEHQAGQLNDDVSVPQVELGRGQHREQSRTPEWNRALPIAVESTGRQRQQAGHDGKRSRRARSPSDVQRRTDQDQHCGRRREPDPQRKRRPL
jgi:hypothetical protein